MITRRLEATRARLDQMLLQGWVITGRAPITLARGLAIATVMPNGVINYSR